MTNFKFLLLSLAFVLSIGGCSSEPSGKPPALREAIAVVFENGGTIAEDDQAFAVETMLNLLDQLARLHKRKATRDTDIYLIATAQPNTIAWSGKPKQLSEQSEAVSALLTFTPSFSDLTMSYKLIETTLALKNINSLRVYHVGAFINVPFQQSDHIEIDLPQAIPNDLALTSLVPYLTHLKLFNVHPDQKAPLQLYLASSGLLKGANSGAIELSVHEASETKANLDNLL